MGSGFFLWTPVDMNARATGRWVRLLIDALMLYALHALGTPWTLLVIIGTLVAVALYLGWKARMVEDV